MIQLQLDAWDSNPAFRANVRFLWELTLHENFDFSWTCKRGYSD